MDQDVDERDDAVPWLEGVGDVAADQQIRAAGAGVLRGKVAHDTAVDEDPALDLDR